ncbi:uncharacterized protein TNCV_359901 [Trichonephila clavipes]|nr:uncharacterized protein TNCV_359901 [Trichonephila clavipes]
MASAFSRSNPIENVWDALGRQVAGRNYPPTNKNTLIRALTEEWDKLPQQLLDNVVQNVAYHRYTLNMQVRSGTKNNSSPNEPSCTTVTRSFNGVFLVETGTWRSPYECLARIRLQTEPGLVENITQDHCCGLHNACSLLQFEKEIEISNAAENAANDAETRNGTILGAWQQDLRPQQNQPRVRAHNYMAAMATQLKQRDTSGRGLRLSLGHLDVWREGKKHST